jgi:succinate dehydrogenase / fumarate reductase flavoprotein subunit
MLDVNEIQTIEHDVLVIGAGGAGLRAAIQSSANGLSTGLLSKSLLGKAHTVMAEGGMAAALGNMDSRDNWKVHFRDTMRGGKFLSDWRMAELHARQSPERVRELEQWGAVFDRTKEGKISQRNFGGHRYPRLAHVGDRTGLELIRTLQDHGVHQGISMHMECTALEILTEGGKVAGVAAYWRETGRFVLFRCPAVILATGGGGKAWRVTSNSWEYTGDGAAMAFDAGAELMDMEFTQFHPTGMVWPPSVRGTLVTEGVRGDGGVLLNNEGDRFMFNYIPERFASETAESIEEASDWLEGKEGARRPPELLTRDVVAKAILAEVKAGRGTPHGGAFLDIATRRPPEFIKRKLPSMYHQFIELAEVDITAESMEVGPTLHYFMGGVRVDSDSQQTRVPGLFACGECAAGMHGANRLGGNSLSDLIVFGKLAGDGATEYIKGLGTRPTASDDVVKSAFRQVTEILNRESGPNPYVLHESLQDLMGDKVGIVRNREDLEQGISEIKALQEEAKLVKAHGSSQYNPGWDEAISLRSLFITALAVARGALIREESRGAHTRLDFEGERDEWLDYNIVIRKGAGGEMEAEKVKRPDPPAGLAAIAHAEIEDLESGRVGAEA